LPPIALGFAALLVATGCKQKSAEEHAAEQRQAEAEQRAERLWRERCVSCHGQRGTGDGPLATTLKTRPADFSDGAWQSREFDDEIEAVIIVGGAALGHSAEMPPHLDLGNDPEAVAALVRKIRSLGRR
jgi:mono/diheme cytochrome c family protein